MENGEALCIGDSERLLFEGGSAAQVAEFADADEAVREAQDDVPGTGLWRWQHVQGKLSRGSGGVRGARRSADGDAQSGGVDARDRGDGREVVVRGAGVGNGPNGGLEGRRATGVHDRR